MGNIKKPSVWVCNAVIIILIAFALFIFMVDILYIIYWDPNRLGADVLE